MISQRWPTWAICLGALAGVAAWVALLSFHRRSARLQTTGPGHHALAPFRMALGAAGVWLAMQALARVLVLATSWPLCSSGSMMSSGKKRIMFRSRPAPTSSTVNHAFAPSG